MPKGAGVEVDEQTFEDVGSGAAATYPKQCSALRKNEFCMIKGKPCKIVEMSTSKTGKHGHAKVHLVTIGVLDGKKYEDICPSTHNMNVPILNTKNYQLCNIDEGYLSLMDDLGNMMERLKVPEDDVGKEITKHFEDGNAITVTVLSVCGEEKVTGCKTIT